MIVTDIKPGRHGKAYIYADGKYIVSLASQTILLNNIKKGSYIDEDILEKLRDESNCYSAKEKALNLLSYKSRSKGELKERLKTAYDENSADSAVQKMEELGLINDLTFAESCANYYIFRKNFSILKTERELLQKGIEKEIISDTLQKIEVDEENQIFNLLKGKYRKKLETEKGIRLTIESLKRLGYAWEQINYALRLYREYIMEGGDNSEIQYWNDQSWL